MTGEDFFKFNKGNEIRFSNYKEIKEEDLKGADEKTKKLFNIFAGEDKVLQASEAQSLFNALKSAAGGNQILEENEISIFTKEKIGEEIKTDKFKQFVQVIFKPTETKENSKEDSSIKNAEIFMSQNDQINSAWEKALYFATNGYSINITTRNKEQILKKAEAICLQILEKELSGQTLLLVQNGENLTALAKFICDQKGLDTKNQQNIQNVIKDLCKTNKDMDPDKININQMIWYDGELDVTNRKSIYTNLSEFIQSDYARISKKFQDKFSIDKVKEFETKGFNSFWAIAEKLLKDENPRIQPNREQIREMTILLDMLNGGNFSEKIYVPKSLKEMYVDAISFIKDNLVNGQKIMERYKESEGPISRFIDLWCQGENDKMEAGIITADPQISAVIMSSPTEGRFKTSKKVYEGFESIEQDIKGLEEAANNPDTFPAEFRRIRNIDYDQAKIDRIYQESRKIADIDVKKYFSELIHQELDEAYKLYQHCKIFGYSREGSDPEFLKSSVENSLYMSVSATLKELLKDGNYNDITKMLNIPKDERGIKLRELLLDEEKSKDYKINKIIEYSIGKSENTFLLNQEEQTNDEIDLSPPKSFYSMPDTRLRLLAEMAENLLNTADESYKNSLEGKTYEQIHADYKKMVKDAFGDKNAEEIVNAFVVSQQESLGYISMGVNLALMAVSMSTGGAVGLLMMPLLVANPVQAAETFLKSNTTEEEKQAYYASCRESVLWMCLGMGCAKLGEFVSTLSKTGRLTTLARQSGKTVDEFAKGLEKIIAGGHVDTQIINTVNRINTISEWMGISTEIASDIGLTMMLQEGGATAMDYVMSISTSIYGGRMMKEYRKLGKGERVHRMMEECKFIEPNGTKRNLKPEELKAINDFIELVNRLDEAVESDSQDVVKRTQESIMKRAEEAKQASGGERAIADIKGEHGAGSRGLMTGDDLLIQRAKTENPAEVVTAKNDQVEIEVNGQRYSTNDISAAESKPDVENSLSQKGADNNKNQISNVMADAEFDAMLPKVKEMLRKYGISTELNKYNILAANKLLSDEKLYNNKNLVNRFGDILGNAETPEQLELVNKLLSDEKLYNNENLVNRFGDILRNAETPEQVQIKINLLDKFLSDEKLYNNENLADNFGYILAYTETPEQAQIKINLLDKFLSDEKLHNNENLAAIFCDILASTDTPERVRLVDKLLFDEKLYNNENLVNRFGNILYSTNTSERLELVNKLLSDEKLYNNENLINKFSDILYYTSTSVQFRLMDKLLSDEKLYNNENLVNEFGGILRRTNTSEHFDLVTKLLSDEKLYNNENLVRRFNTILSCTNTPEQAQVKINFMDKFLSTGKLYNNESLTADLGDILRNAETPEQVQIKINLLDKFLSDEKLYNNENLADNFGYILAYTETPEQAQIKINLLDKFLSDEKLYNNENLADEFYVILHYIQTSERWELANKLLSDEKLYNNENLVNKFGNILRHTGTPERFELVNKLLSDEKLYNNKNLINEFSNILYNTDTSEQAQIKINLLDKFLSDEKLHNNENLAAIFCDIIAYTDTPERVRLVDKLLSDEKLYNNENLADEFYVILHYIQTSERWELANKLLSDEKLYNNENLVNKFGNILRHTGTPERFELVNKLLSDEKLYNNESLVKRFIDILSDINTLEQAQIKINLLDKFLFVEKLYNNEHLIAIFGNILRHTETPEQFDLVNKFLFDKKLHNNEDLVKVFGSIIHYTKMPERLEFVNKLLFDEKLYNNENLVKRFDTILYNTNTSERVRLVDKLLSDEKLYNNENLVNEFGGILRYTNTSEHFDLVTKLLSDEKFYNNESLVKRFGNILYITDTSERVRLVDKFLSDEKLYNNEVIMKDLEGLILIKSADYLINQDINKIKEGVDFQLKKVLEAPDRYVNGDYDSKAGMMDAVNSFFDERQVELLIMSEVYDKEAFNHLLRMRFDDVEEYLDIVSEFENSDIELLVKMNNSTNVDGKPFMPTQKVEFIDLLQAYKANELDFAPIKEMVESGKLDIGRLQIDLFNEIMKRSGLSEEEIASIPKEKLILWDSKYTHLLSKEIQASRDAAFSDIIRYGSLEPDFMEYLHNTENVYGKTNAKTMAMFEELNLDYNKWINSSKGNEVHFVIRDKNQERLSQIAKQLTEDIETLRSGPVRGFIDKQLPHCIKDGKFIVPTEVMGSKVKLNEFISNLIKQLDTVWKRAEGNSTNPDPKRAQTARNTLTILDHFNQRIDDISKISEDKIIQDFDWRIKMWDRNPQKDIFQGNYSTCCIGMGGGNGSAMPHFVMNTAYNMIEVVDNKSGKTIGNALCYFVKDKEGTPAFIIDNIEINNKYKPSDKEGIKLREQIAEYASSVVKEVTGKDNISIYIGDSYNDVPCSNLKKLKKEVTFIGDVDCDDIYMDLYDGWVAKDEFTSNVTLLQLK